MEEEEPSFGEFMQSIGDAVLSNWLVDSLKRKFQAQSYFEFFNRISATGLLLFIIGIVGAGIFIFFEEFELTVLDLGNTIILGTIALVIFFLLELVSTINVGKTPIYGGEVPEWKVELVKIFGGSIILGALGYVILGEPNPLDVIVFSLISAVLVGIWLLGLAWLFGGLIGISRLRNHDE